MGGHHPIYWEPEQNKKGKRRANSFSLLLGWAVHLLLPSGTHGPGSWAFGLPGLTAGAARVLRSLDSDCMTPSGSWFSNLQTTDQHEFSASITIWDDCWYTCPHSWPLRRWFSNDWFQSIPWTPAPQSFNRYSPNANYILVTVLGFRNSTRN